ncbi:hypothetical protein Daus18300_014002 [Diaporthe australafricana]|uniref:Uncharacterized protein n=1 Tax=Diaporthe australafricana TaxID=127596 RepID=A0ABR3VWW7_9PEZI
MDPHQNPHQDPQVDLDVPQDAAPPSNEAFLDMNGPEDQSEDQSVDQILRREWPTIECNEAQRLVQARVSRIFDSHATLRAILERHEATIQKRWTKKTKAQRLAVLLKAWPNMAPKHRPDIIEFRAMVRQKIDDVSKTKHKDYFMWPYINQEDLADPKMLLLLLDARARHNPCEFAAADAEWLRFGKAVRALIPVLVIECAMILQCANGSDEYGRLVSPDENPDIENWVESRRQFLSEDGLMVLQVQDRLMSFLVKCCKQILHDIPEKTLISDAFPIKPQPKLNTGSKTGGFSSLAVVIAEAPYRVSAQLDLDRVESLLTAKTSASEDHIWSLREDPSYFAETQDDIAEHRSEMVKDFFGKAAGVLGKDHKPARWGAVSNTMILSAYHSLEVFSELQSQAQELRVLQEKHAADISPLTDLPQEYAYAIAKFYYFAGKATAAFIFMLKCSVMASPSFRKFHVRVGSDTVMATEEVLKRRGVKAELHERKVLDLFILLWGPDLKAIRPPDVVDEIERLLDLDPKARGLITPCLANFIGKISIVSHCLRQVENYQPWAGRIIHAIGENKVRLQCEFDAKNPLWLAMFTAILQDKKTMAQMGELGDITGGRFTYPIGKRQQTMAFEETEALRRSEANLDAFWAYVDQLTYAKSGELDGFAVQRLLKEPRSIQRTPESVDPIEQANPETKVPAPDGDTACGPSYKPMSTVYFGLSPSKPEDNENSQPRTKTKTRGTANTSSSSTSGSTPEAQDQDEPTPQPTTFQVDARALQVFRTLFHDASVRATPGELPWQEFLHAMVSVGFVPEKLYGSVWQFQPAAELDVGRSIQFHEPHPRPKMPYWIARHHGRRLNRAYGWTGEMFTLREK